MKGHWTDRTELLLGKDKMQRLRDAHVLVVGVGGVGAYAAEMLCRAGVGTLTLVDADTVQPTNINRQLPATHATLGRPKVEVLAERFRDINPDVRVNALPVYIKEEDVEALLLGVQKFRSSEVQTNAMEGQSPVLLSEAITPKPLKSTEKIDFIVDAIDTIAPKCSLITEAMRRGIPIVSSMGAGAKSDITQIRFADIWDTYHCGLAKAVRTRLKKEGLRRPLPVVFSTEQADRCAIITVEGEQNKKSTTGTISYMPAVFGCYLAEYAIRKITIKG
jgi:tRNA A37 threonylcarbamoyladenosine dehydratase